MQTISLSGTATSTSQTITFTPPSSPVTYGVSPISLSASASSGLAVTFSVLSGPGTVSGSTLTVTGVGTIVVAANQAGNSNYTAATQVTQSIVVNQAPPTITFTVPNHTYGDAPFTVYCDLELIRCDYIFGGERASDDLRLDSDADGRGNSGAAGEPGCGGQLRIWARRPPPSPWRATPRPSPSPFRTIPMAMRRSRCRRPRTHLGRLHTRW